MKRVFLVILLLLASCETKVKDVDTCGDGFLDANEQCEADDLSGATCREFDRFFGVPACSGECTPLPGSCSELLTWNVDGDPSIINAYSVAADPQGNLYVAGQNYAPMHGQPEMSSSPASSAGRSTVSPTVGTSTCSSPSSTSTASAAGRAC